jgi:hypothetical protein
MSRLAAVFCVFAAIAAGLSYAFHDPAVGFIVAGVITLGGPLAFARIEGRNRPQAPSPHWRGYVSFYEESLRDQFPDIRARRAVGGIGRKGLSSGKCEFDQLGVHWKSGGWATPQTRIAGTFDLPWSRIASGLAYSLPGKVPGLGGGVDLVLTDSDSTISGRFLGSVEGLNKAIQSGVQSQYVSN